MKKYSKPTISVKYYCTEDFCSSISSCDYWSCLVNSNQHEYVADLENYSSLSELLNALKNNTYGYCTYSYSGTTYYIWTSSYNASESTDGSALSLLQTILGITKDEYGELSGDWLTYIENGMVHFTSGVTSAAVYSS